MFKIQLLLSILVVSNENLFAVIDLISILPAERQRQVADESGYNLPNARLAAVRFLLIKSPEVANPIKLTLMESIGQLFTDGRPVIKESDIYSKITQIAHSNGIMIDLSEYEKSDLSDICTDVGRLNITAPGMTAARPITLSLTKFMSTEEKSRVLDQRGYYPGQLNDALRRFLAKNGTPLSEEKIRDIKKEFNDKYFKGASSGRRVAVMNDVDADLTSLIDDHKLDASSIAIPKVEHCIICRTDIEEALEIKYCINGHTFHKECATLYRDGKLCSLCQAKFHLDSEDLFKSAKDGDRLTVARCIAARADVNSVDRFDFTALMRAAENGHKDIVAMLLGAGADVNATGQYCNTALMRAAGNGHKDVVAMLLRAGAYVKAVSRYGNTALKLATEKGHAEIAEMLLLNGKPEVSFTSAKHVNSPEALFTSAEHGDMLAVARCIAAGVDVDSVDQFDRTALMMAAENGHKDVVEMLLLAGANVNAAREPYGTALMMAAQCGHEEVVAMLLGAGANVNVANSFGRTALMRAAENGHKEVVAMLLRAGADVKAVSQSAIRH